MVSHKLESFMQESWYNVTSHDMGGCISRLHACLPAQAELQ